MASAQRTTSFASKWRSIWHSILVLAVIALLAACASTQASSPPAPTASAAAASTGTTLVLWHGWSGPARQVLTSLVDDFNRQHPNGRVFVQSAPLSSMSSDLRAAAAAGSGPHMALIPNTWVGGMARDQLIVPLDGLVPASEQQTLLPATLGGAQATGKDGQHLYGLPISFDTLAMFYNHANVEAPPNTGTMLQIAHGLSAPRATPPRWGLAMSLSLDDTIGYLYAFDGRVFDSAGKPVLGSVGRAGAERWLQWLATLQADDQLLAHPDAGLEQERALKNGTVFISFGWAHELADYRRLWDRNMGVAALPVLSETQKAPQPYVQSDVLVINSRASAAEQQIAQAFLRFMISEQAQAKLLTGDVQPASKALPLNDNTPQHMAARAFRAAAETGQPMPNGTNRNATQQVLLLMQRQVLAGSATPADAVSEAETRLEAIANQPTP